jgi:glucokinase
VRIVADVLLEARAAGLDPSAVGLGFPGLADTARGVARSSVMLDGWREVALAKRVALATGLECAVDNDVNAAALAELRARGVPGAGAGTSAGAGGRSGDDGAMLFVAVGTGIGGALALGGRLYRGASGVAGEIGNTTVDLHGPRCFCGRRGCLNALASGTAIERRLGIAPGTLAAHVAADADGRAWPVLEQAAWALGAGLANAINLLNPELIVLGGGVARLGARFLAAVERAAREEAFAEAAAACRIEAARAGYEAGAVGAALLAHERLDALAAARSCDADVLVAADADARRAAPRSERISLTAL